MGAWLAADGAPSIICNLDASYSGNQVRLQGRIISSSKVAGRYSLEILQANRSGHASINQSGPFQVTGGEPGDFGTATMSLQYGMRLIARFTVTPSGAETPCVAEREISDD
jgi:hypothetical protein